MNTAQEDAYGYSADREILLRVRAMEAIRNMRTTAESHGWMTDDEIASEISLSRQNRRGMSNREGRN